MEAFKAFLLKIPQEGSHIRLVESPAQSMLLPWSSINSTSISFDY